MSRSGLTTLLAALGLAPLALACGPKPGDTNDDATASSEGEAVASSDVPTTDVSTDSASDPSAATVTTTTTAGTSATTATTTPPDDLPDACTAYCERFLECLPDLAEPLAECVLKCQASVLDTPECTTTYSAVLGCAAALSCDGFTEFILSDAPTVCVDEFVTFLELCDGPGCTLEGSGGGDGCSLGRDCGDTKQDYQCMAGTCTCVENGVPGESCPAEGFCGLDEVTQVETVGTCCGWDWT